MNKLKSIYILHIRTLTIATVIILTQIATTAIAQFAPSAQDVAQYNSLQLAAHTGDLAKLESELNAGADISIVDGKQRNLAHIAAFGSHERILRILARYELSLNALEFQKYDIVTIAAVANDPKFLKVALELGANAGKTTSIYDGTALIAAAHLGHYEVVQILVESGAPLDHVNSLNWTALIESVVLGDGGKNHVRTAKILVEAGADKSIGDGNGVTPLEHALQRGYAEMVGVLSD